MVFLLFEALDLLVDHQVRRLADLLTAPQRAICFALEVVVARTQKLALMLTARFDIPRPREVALLNRCEVLLEARLLASPLLAAGSRGTRGARRVSLAPLFSQRGLSRTSSSTLIFDSTSRTNARPSSNVCA